MFGRHLGLLPDLDFWALGLPSLPAVVVVRLFVIKRASLLNWRPGNLSLWEKHASVWIGVHHRLLSFWLCLLRVVVVWLLLIAFAWIREVHRFDLVALVLLRVHILLCLIIIICWHSVKIWLVWRRYVLLHLTT